MKKIDIGQAITISANLGVIAGIIFLAVELQQNNRLLDAQVSYNLMRNRMDWRNDVYRDPEFAAFDFKVFNGEDLDELEAYRVRRDSEATIIGMEWEYLQFRDGNLSYLPLDQWKRIMNEPGYRSNDWERNKYLLSEEFIAFVETEILAD